MLAHRGDHAGGKRIILVSNGAKLANSSGEGGQVIERIGCGGSIRTTDLWVMSPTRIVITTTYKTRVAT